MRSGEIPVRFEPRRLARESAELHGTIAATRLTRLASAVVQVGDAVSLQASVGVDEVARPLIEGVASVPVTLRCQRCLEPMEQNLSAAFRLAVVHSEAQAQRLPEELDAVIVEGETIDTTAMVEDELILALPVVARHESLRDCDVDRQFLTPESGGSAPQPKDDTNPFAALEALKRRQND